jgi:replicative DNA helicase
MADENYTASAGRKPKQRGAQANAEGLSNYVFGKVQPQALPLEEAVLGALMLDREALPVVMDILRPESFYLEAHQSIYRAIIKLFERSHPVDLLTVTEELRKSAELDKIGGAYYLVELTNRVASAANIEYHARIVAQKHIQRELIRVSTSIIKDAYEDTTDVFDLLDDAEKGLFGITQNNLSRSYESMDMLSSKVLKQIEELSQKADGLTGVPTGFTDLDRLTSGWQPSDLIIVAARPGMGKTSMVLAMTLNAARDFNKPVALFSLEMASTQLVQRLISMEAEIEGSKMRNGKLEDWQWQQLQKTVDKLSKVPIFIDDTPGINIFELRAKCRRLKMQHDIQLVIIDYLQLMTGSSENNRNSNREQEISGISRALKNMAKELSVPVIALSQLSRAVETRGGSKRPQLSDLRECVTGDTLVTLATGKEVPIKDLVGQTPWVKSFDPRTNRFVNAKTDLIWSVGVKPVWKITLGNGQSIKATPEHRLFASTGWKTVAELTTSDALAICPKTTANQLAFAGAGGEEELEEPEKEWNRITQLEFIGKEEVFDLTVPETASWIANGIISHNSGAIEQDADIVSFIYRPEYYGILQDEEGQSLKGIAEFIVAKHRHGALDTIRIKFLDNFAKFTNLDDPSFPGFESPLSGPFTPSTVIPSRMNDEDIPF